MTAVGTDLSYMRMTDKADEPKPIKALETSTTSSGGRKIAYGTVLCKIFCCGCISIVTIVAGAILTSLCYENRYTGNKPHWCNKVINFGEFGLVTVGLGAVILFLQIYTCCCFISPRTGRFDGCYEDELNQG